MPIPKSAGFIFAFYKNSGDFFVKSFDQHYAPLHYLINVGLFQLFQKPLPLYLINLMLFYMDCLLMFLLIYFISDQFIAALWTTVIFVIHPMTGEILQHITRSSIFVQNIFLESGLLFLYLYSKHHRNILYYFLSLLMVFLALFCQETALLFPLYAAALLFFLTDFQLKRIIKVIMPFIFLDFLFIGLWLLVVNPHIHLEGMNILHPGFFWSTCANFSHIFFWYLSNLFVPHNIVYMCSMRPLASFIWLWNLLFFGFLTGCGLFIFCYLKKSLESFALVLFLTGFVYAFISSQA